MLRDKAKIHHWSQVFQEVGSWGQNSLIEKIAEKGTVGFALFGHGRPQYLLRVYAIVTRYIGFSK
ncbi:MAG: hypothetical protein ACLQED_11315 [Desulfobaccales bacterium]